LDENFTSPAAGAAVSTKAMGPAPADDAREARRRAVAVRAVVDRMRGAIESPTDSDDERRDGDDLFLLRPLQL
jgi:hypothetical protein